MTPRRHRCLVITVSLLMACSAETWARSEDDEPVNRPVRIDGPPAPVAPEVVARDGTGRVTLRANRIHEPLQIDGSLDESVYARVQAVSDFVQQEPHEGQPSEETTETWVFFDNANLYISARLSDSDPESIVANEMRRDNRSIESNDNFAVILDTFYDRRNGFLFSTNPLGALADSQVTDERNANSDWNTVWSVETHRNALGWSVEMQIPFKSLRYEGGGTQIWGLNFRRFVRSRNEWSYLTPVPASFFREGILKLSFGATLVGLELPTQNINLELKPFVTSGLATDLEAEPQVENDLDADIGFDVKYGLTRSLIADFTYNTDFAQVEADDAQVNLTRFSLFFPEKREFFLEGQGIFNFGGRVSRLFEGPSDMPILFFSRTIGLNDGERVPIQAGARVSGRTGAYSVGLLNIQTKDLLLPESTIPSTNFSVMRLKRDVFRRSNIGVIATHRSHSVDSDASNSVFGLDGNFAFFQNLNINAYYARTSTSELDAADEQSYRGALNFDRDLFGFSLEHLVVGENFNPEVGFVRRDNIRKNAATLRFSRRPQAIPWLRKIDFDSRFDVYENLDGRVESRSFSFEAQGRMESSDFLSVEYRHEFEFLFEPFEILDDVEIPVGGYTFDRLRVGHWFGRQRPVSGWIGVEGGSFFNGDRVELSHFGRVELSSQLLLEPRFSLNWIDLPQGRFRTDLLSVRTTYTISPRVFVAALVQYQSNADALTTNIRFRWEYEPGSDFFLVYSDGRSTLDRGFPGLQNRSLIMKFTRFFRF